MHGDILLSLQSLSGRVRSAATRFVCRVVVVVWGGGRHACRHSRQAVLLGFMQCMHAAQCVVSLGLARLEGDYTMDSLQPSYTGRYNRLQTCCLQTDMHVSAAVRLHLLLSAL
jgi:hypothetical protein